MQLRRSGVLGAVLAFTLAPALAAQAAPRAMTWTDVMSFRAIRSSVLSADGAWVAWDERPDRGDSSVAAKNVVTGTKHTIDHATQPSIDATSRWLLARIEPSFEARRQAHDAKGDGKPKNGLAILELATGNVEAVDRVRRHAIAKSGAVAVWLHDEPPATPPTSDDEKPTGDDAKTDDGGKKKPSKAAGTELVRRPLTGGDAPELRIPRVIDFALDPDGDHLAYVQADEEGHGRAVWILAHDAQDGIRIHHGERARPSTLTWAKTGSRFAFVAGDAEGDDGKRTSTTAAIHFWSPGDATATRLAAGTDGAPAEHAAVSHSTLRWSDDGARLFIGFAPRDAVDVLTALQQRQAAEKDAPPPAATDLVGLLDDVELDVWHSHDPRISPQQKKSWSRHSKRVHVAVYDVARGTTQPLADAALASVNPATDPAATRTLGRSTLAYDREVTWDGRYGDVYVVDLANGSRTRVLTRQPLNHAVSLSPSGRWLVWYRDGAWTLRDNDSGTERALTANVDVPFADEDHDYPSPVPGYGVGGWLAGESGVLIYDKYDVWHAATTGDGLDCVTLGQGRAEGRTFRIVDTDPDTETVPTSSALLLSSFVHATKNTGFWRLHLGEDGPPQRLAEGEKRYRFVAKAADTERYLFTRESYDEYPDLWVTAPDFAEPVRASWLDRQRDAFAWGSSELVEWTSLDGKPLQGALIKPADWQPGRRYPVLVYYYRFFSQRVHEWNQVVVNHRPCFSYYASNGYCVFLPDVRFDIGRPGFAATKCVVPGVQKLIDLGIADADAIGLHGHSWSGYQTAFVITQSDLFACAIAGAPVSNMTSAYGGIRWGTGLSRQFQYEKAQSRLGGSLWDTPERYIENSPVFFADRIATPLLIQFGDEDGAVPWYQGIELYMAMRRLDKPCVFLQYRGEPHHLQKYANKLDYSMKMKAFLDHHLRGEPAPDWWTEGVEYAGR